MKKLIQWSIKNSPAMNTLMIASLIVGLVCLLVMRREIFPEFELEIVLVTVPYPGASPEEIEEGICQKIEEKLSNIKGLKKMTAVAREGSGFLIMELNSSVKDVQKVLNEVKSEIAQIPSFPVLAEKPNSNDYSFEFTVTSTSPDLDDLLTEINSVSVDNAPATAISGSTFSPL